ncbi:UNVERIFIED_CONTAM: hypothetical protein FKN15_064886 [Acipenser sinensis]
MDGVYKVLKQFAQERKKHMQYLPHYYFVKAYTMMDLLPNMKMFASHLQKEKSLRSAILVEQGMSVNEPSKKLLAFFKQMLKSNVIKIENKTYLQRCGIPQGCILSTLLCCLCYGDMENKLLSGVQRDGTLAAGIPEYGCIISPHKTAVNFPIDDIPGCAEAKQLPGVCMFPWCGLLLDTRTAEVFCDYGR